MVFDENLKMAHPVSVVQALVKKYGEENCIVDDFAHIDLSSKTKEKTKDHGINCFGLWFILMEMLR